MKYRFKETLKVANEYEFRISCGRLFHVRGPRYLIFLLATDVLTKGITYPYRELRVEYW